MTKTIDHVPTQSMPSTWLAQMTASSLIGLYAPFVLAMGISMEMLRSTSLNPVKGSLLLGAQVGCAVFGVFRLIRSKRHA